MRISLDISENLEKNAQKYFEKSKKAKKKLEGAKKALEKTKDRLEKVKKSPLEETKSVEDRKRRKKEWYEKYHWFKTSEGELVIGGRDASTNEMVVKKHTDSNDFVFHTDMAGSPFVVVKSDGKISDKTKKEAAEFTLAYAKAWKRGMATAAVFYVKPNQVSKEANSGEYLPKGSFMIYGETKYVDNPTMNFAVGIYKEDENDPGKVMGGPVEAVKANCEDYVEVKQGKGKTSDAAKKIRHKIGGNLDDIIRVLPAGGVETA